MTEHNWKNRTLWTGIDNIYVMRGMNSESVDLIYLDPPFNSKKTYSAPIGSKAAGVSFKDTWTFDDVDRIWLAVLCTEKSPLYHVIEAPRHAHGMAAYIEPGSPWEDGYIESFNARLRDELLDGEIFFTLREAQVLIEVWRRHYNTVRPHGSLGYRPPTPEAIGRD